MFEKGATVIYGNTGVCRIEEVSHIETPGFDKDKLYYTLRPLFDNCVIYTPVDTGVFMRPAITAEEAEHLIDMIPDIAGEMFHSSRTQELAEHYEAAINAHSCTDLISLVKSIYAKKQYAEQQRRKVGQVDERFMRQAEALLYGEFAVALDMPRERVADYISERLESIEGAASAQS